MSRPIRSCRWPTIDWAPEPPALRGRSRSCRRTRWSCLRPGRRRPEQRRKSATERLDTCLFSTVSFLNSWPEPDHNHTCHEGGKPGQNLTRDEEGGKCEESSEPARDPSGPGPRLPWRGPNTARRLCRAIQHCLTQLDDTQIWWRPHQNMNSAGNLVLHLTGNLGKRFLSDIAGEPFHRDRFGEFTERRMIPRDESCNRSVRSSATSMLC